ncbi:hypothetical protein [Novosphingobium sp.]|uniref:hypothetical protein n=1 Tax=Novosphingobium sp. TaxID=1874826 RepID=UPI002FDEB56C
MLQGKSRARRVALSLALSCGAWASTALAPAAFAQEAYGAAYAGAAPAGNGVGSAIELEFWRAVAGSSDPDMYAAYLQQYPAGSFAPVARVKLNALRRMAPAAAPALPAPPLAPATPLTPAAPVTPAALIPAVQEPAAPALPAARPLPPPAMAAAPVPAQQVVAAGTPAAGPDSASDTALLAQLAASQETPVAAPAQMLPASAVTPAATMPAAQAVPVAATPAVVPAVLVADRGATLASGRPALAQVTPLAVPRSFCTAADRNTWHATVFRPAADAAEANNARAVAYLRGIQARYDGLALGDPSMRNALAAEGAAYKPVADATFAAQQALVQQFDALMAVPIQPCMASR